MLIPGGCHCGNIRFTLEWRPAPQQIPARACGCSFCTKHGGVWTSCPEGLLEVRVRDPSLVQHYAFGTRTADFHLCRRCGVVALVTSCIREQLYAVVSVNALEGLAPALRKEAAVSFEGEGEAERLERRARNWIASVRFS